MSFEEPPLPRRRRLKLMVSSTVHDKVDLLCQVYATLTTYGYEVWMSERGTLPILPGRTAVESCLMAIEECDLFLGILTGRYGSADGTSLSITHQEFQRAIDLGKVRYFAVHNNVTVARQLLKQFRFDEHGNKHPHTFLKATAILSDARVLDMYDLVIREDLPLAERTDNWAQTYHRPEDLMTFLQAQFSDPTRFRRHLLDQGGPA